jgi:hypothetical protein
VESLNYIIIERIIRMWDDLVSDNSYMFKPRLPIGEVDNKI